MTQRSADHRLVGGYDMPTCLTAGAAVGQREIFLSTLLAARSERQLALAVVVKPVDFVQLVAALSGA